MIIVSNGQMAQNGTSATKSVVFKHDPGLHVLFQIYIVAEKASLVFFKVFLLFKTFVAGRTGTVSLAQICRGMLVGAAMTSPRFSNICT